MDKQKKISPLILNEEIIVLGAGGHGKSVISVAIYSSISVAGIFDDSPKMWGKDIFGIRVYGPIEEFRQYPDRQAVMGLGNNEARRKTADFFPDALWSQILCKTSYISFSASIGPGSVVFPNSTIAADVRLGSHVIISANVTVGHDTVVEDFVHIAPGVQIGGNSYIGAGAMIGIGSTICPGVHIGKDAIVAAGAVVVKDVAANSKVFGIPAKIKNDS